MYSVKRSILVMMSFVLSTPLSAVPFHELGQVRNNADFAYEQMQMPPSLRKLLTVIDVAAHLPGRDQHAQVHRLDDLLHHEVPTAGIHYVARSFAPETYQSIADMSRRLRIDTPLLFVAYRGTASHGVDVMRLGGNFYGLILGSSFLRQRTVDECRAMIAYRLAQIARKDYEKQAITRVVFPAVFLIGGTAYSAYLLHKALQNPDKERRWDDIKETLRQSAISWGLWGTALGVTWIISELAYAHMSRKAARQADVDALRAFGGDAEEYMQCLQQAYNDQIMAHEQQRGAERLYHFYVRAKIDEAMASLHDGPITAFLYHALEKCQEHKKKITSSGEDQSWFATTPSLHGRLEYMRKIAHDRHENGDDANQDEDYHTH